MAAVLESVSVAVCCDEECLLAFVNLLLQYRLIAAAVWCDSFIHESFSFCGWCNGHGKDLEPESGSVPVWQLPTSRDM